MVDSQVEVLMVLSADEAVKVEATMEEGARGFSAEKRMLGFRQAYALSFDIGRESARRWASSGLH